MSEHSIAPPSGLHQIVQCPGSITMQQPFPMPPDHKAALAAAEGTAAHWAMAVLMTGVEPKPGERAPNGVLLDADMIDAAHVIVNDVRDTIAPYGLSLAQCATEVPVSISRVHPLCWGTPDIRVWLPGPTLAIWDLKYGHRHVEVFENYQMAAYTAGCMEQAGFHDQQVAVISKIVQPRAYDGRGSVREWRHVGTDIRALINIAHSAVGEALGPNPRTQVGPACTDCRARHACPTLQRASGAAMDVAGGAVPHELSADALGVELRFINRMFDLLEARKEGLTEQALALSRRGARIPNFRAESGAGRTVWKKPAGEVIAAGKLLGIDLAKAPEAITPQQAVAAGLPEVLLGTFAEPRGGAMKLVPDDGSAMRRVFAAGKP